MSSKHSATACSGDAQLTTAPRATPAERGRYYLRLLVKDRPGVVAAISDRLAHEEISIESFLQMPVQDGPGVPIVLTTQTCARVKMEAAVKTMEALDVIAEAPFVMPVEHAGQGWGRSGATSLATNWRLRSRARL